MCLFCHLSPPTSLTAYLLIMFVSQGLFSARAVRAHKTIVEQAVKLLL